MTKIEFGWAIPSGARATTHRAVFLQDLDGYFNALTGFSTAWMTDHFQWEERDTLESWTTLCYLASQYSRFKFGNVVLCQSYRNPALTAKMAATLQFLSGGRFLFGIGAGWKEDEYKAYGYPFPGPGTRVEQLEETLHIVKAMWTQEKATYIGKHYRVEDAYCQPKPHPVPPIMVGGEGDKMLRVVARHADWWNVSWMGYPTYVERLAELKRACDEVGRDPSTLRLTWFGGAAIGRTQEEAQALATGNISDENAFVGTPAYFVEKIGRFAELGVTKFIFGIRGFPDTTPAKRLVDEVLPKVNA